MNKIQFRGKRVSDGTWVYGDLLTQYLHHNGATIVEYGCVCNEVTPDTVGQLTGLSDGSGTKIWKGDILACTHWFFDGGEIDEHFTAFVGFGNGSFTLEGIRSRYYSDYTGEKDGEGMCWIGAINFCPDDYAIIGNIHDNPELLDV